MTLNLGKRWRQVRVIVVPLCIVLLVVTLLAADGLRSRTVQLNKYKLPLDHSAPRMLEFMREMEGSIQGAGYFESSNARSICNAVREAYGYLEADSQNLTEAERREADFCHIKFWGGSLQQGLLPGTDEELNAYLTAIKSFLASAQTFAARESLLSSQGVLVLESYGKLDEEIQYGHWLIEQLKLRPEFSTDSARITSQKVADVMHRLGMINSTLELKSFTIEGQEFELESLRGKVVLIEFWGVRCGPCIADLPALKRIHSEYKERGFEIVGICLHDSSARIKSYLAKHQLPWKQLCDDKTAGTECNQRFAERFGVEAIPTTILIDQNGKVVAMGVRPLVRDAKRDLETWLENLLPK